MKTNTNFNLAKRSFLLLAIIGLVSSGSAMAHSGDELLFGSAKYLSKVTDDSKSISFNTFAEIFLTEANEEDYQVEEWMHHIEVLISEEELEDDAYDFEPWMNKIHERSTTHDEELEIEPWMLDPASW